MPFPRLGAGAGAAAAPLASPAVDRAIEEAWFAASDEEAAERERDRIADELAYAAIQPVLEASAGDQAALNELAQALTLPQEDKRKALEEAEAITRRIMYPLAYELLRTKGLNPATASADAVKQALKSDLTPEEAEQLQKAYTAAFDKDVAPQVQQLLEEAGVAVDASTPEDVWGAADRYIKQEAAAAGRGGGANGGANGRLLGADRGALALGASAAFLGAAAGAGLMRLAAWARRRRRRAAGRGGGGGGGGSSGSQASEASAWGAEDA